MRYDAVIDAVAEIRQKAISADPVEMCKELDIVLRAPQMGTKPGALKGFYYMSCRVPSITVNGSLPEIFQRIIVAHEIGHAVLHASEVFSRFTDFSVFDETSVKEREANLFAAEMLLRDEDVLEAMYGDTTFSAAASALLVPMELLDFKFRVMKSKGFKLMESPIQARSNFLKKFEVPENADYRLN